MSGFVVVGSQWGDEGKGKIVDLLTERVDIVARYGGGPNAGHTICIGEARFALHHIPSGILRDSVLCVIGNGVVIEPASLIKEIDDLRAAGVRVEENLRISDRAHLILPYHRGRDIAREEGDGAGRIGTTRLGVGPAYEGKAGRYGLRVADLWDEAGLSDKVSALARVTRGDAQKLPAEWDPDPTVVVEQLKAYGARLRPFVSDTSRLLNDRLDEGAVVLCEGAQGSMLDIDHGTYPFVTSSSSTAGGACTGLGISPIRVDGVIGVLKAYSTRVGEGPFPTEQDNEAGRRIRERGREFGSTTGRPRRCGWFDALVARYSVTINQIECMALTLFDVLDDLEEIPVCVAYEHLDRRIDVLPADPAVLKACRPVYERLPGWNRDTSKVRRFEELPQAARNYVRRLEEIVGCEIGIVSTSPQRDGTIIRAGSRLERWLPARQALRARA
ncbi:MAG TPA: adenylosuccinate synthase [Candidatus Polarisedimenticolia bacterium]|nr:adenylosuccinate synthase [Candidatus Polarisedimenticolia bacterium]